MTSTWLGWMHAVAVNPDAAASIASIGKALRVGDVEMHRVDRRLASRTGGQQDASARHAGDVAVATVRLAARRAAEARDEILRAPHQRADVRERRDAISLRDALRGLAQRDHLETAIDLREALRRLRLGDHDPAVVRLRQGREIGGVIRGTRRIHPHDHAGGIQLGLDERAARGGLRRRGDRILEVEDHRIRPLERLLVPLRDDRPGRTAAPVRGRSAPGRS